jgi:hypothetical protein
MLSRLLRVTAALMAISFCLAAPLLARQQNGSAPATSQAATSPTKTIVDQSISGGVYRSGGGHFTLTVPEGWTTNDDIVEPKFGVGGLGSPDNEAQLLIQQMPTQETPAIFAKKFDADGGRLFQGYRKISESKLSVAGRNCEVLTLAYIQHRMADGAAVEMPTVSMMVVMPGNHSLLVFNFVTLETLLDKEAPIFENILQSFHSTAQEDFSPKSK